jgi:putative zinc finger protein
MCDFSGNLIAWLDGELSPEEAERARQHLERCSDCQSRVDAYRQVTREFNALCDEQLASAAPHDTSRWTAAIAAAGAVAAVLALLILMPRMRVRHPVVAPQGEAVSAPTAVSVPEPLPLPVPRVSKPHLKRAAETPVLVRNPSNPLTHGQSAYAPPYEPVIEISIPAEEMFPPGAVPAGMGFSADVAIGPDGSADRLRLQPRLVGFERGTSIP